MDGSYNGYFLREPFFKKIYEYNTLEQRYMYIYTLDFDQKQILQLLYHLFELRKATFKYYFLDGNCASQATDLLNIVNNKNRKNSIYYLPINSVQNNKKNIIQKTRFIPLINKLTLLLDKMTSKEKKLFNQIIKQHLQVTKNMPDIVKEAMVYYSTFYFRKFHRVYKNYNSVMRQNYKKQIIKDESLEPLKKTKPSNIGLGLYSQNNINYLYFHYRPLFIDMFDIQLNSLQESEVDIFTFDTIFNKENSKLLKFNFLNIKSFPTQLSFYKPMSWAIYSGLNRNNKDNLIKSNNEIGFGKTLSVLNYSTINMLLYLGNDNSDIYIMPYLNINTYLSNNAKIGISTYYKKYDGDNYNNNRIFLSYRYENFLYSLEYSEDNSAYDEKYVFNIKYNF
ncbi:putative outermembrane protein [hydrothermal vent metagenome]|uniref:Putative outermembrane protein n=1 Tax=hydrothermal vent metagenome TaxID=652676 RepID=A0A3B1E592_9ZZZZ